MRELNAIRGPEPWAVKDSFGVLDLASAGFRPLLAAEWILRPAALAPPGAALPGVRRIRVESERALAEWEEAWGESRGGPRVFLPALLRRSEIAILGLVDPEGRITAGVVANRAAGAVGLSNLFLRGAERDDLRAGCVRAVLEAFPGLPLVGYEAAEDLAAARALGFQTLGSLRIWLKDVGAEAR